MKRNSFLILLLLLFEKEQRRRSGAYAPHTHNLSILDEAAKQNKKKWHIFFRSEQGDEVRAGGGVREKCLTRLAIFKSVFIVGGAAAAACGATTRCLCIVYVNA